MMTMRLRPFGFDLEGIRGRFWVEDKSPVQTGGLVCCSAARAKVEAAARPAAVRNPRRVRLFFFESWLEGCEDGLLEGWFIAAMGFCSLKLRDLVVWVRVDGVLWMDLQDIAF